MDFWITFLLLLFAASVLLVLYWTFELMFGMLMVILARSIRAITKLFKRS